ncbi:MAG TPA: cystathionine beta-lyase [Xanthobacteraceae bacterium]
MILKNGHHVDTVLEHTGRDPTNNFGIVNPPVYHASTILFPSLEALLETRIDRASGAFEGITYGREGTPTTRAFEQAITDLEGGYRAVTLPCGLGAIATSLMAFLKAGDHLLMPDQLYGPARQFCDDVLAKFGVEVTYYDGTIGAGIAGLMKPNTSVVYLESPGSLTFEVQDVPAIARVARHHGAKVLMDNTWASPIFFHPLAHGVDVVIHAATKYISGHSDLMLGVAVCNAASFVPVKKTASTAGYCGGPDDVYMALRGLRTLGIRMRRHHESAMAIAAWLQQRPEVHRVYCPALPDSPGYAIWKRDFLGASGLFGFTLKPFSDSAFAAFLDHTDLFKLGYSWGGYESLMVPTYPATLRSRTRWDAPGPSVRIHVGLENVDDLIRDLEQAFARLHAAP